jgi:hypothetical protein
MIDHRMRPAAREFIVAQIDQRVLAALPHILDRCSARTGEFDQTFRSASPSSMDAS